MTARLILVLLIAVAAPAAPASASTLVYQCGAAVCAIDPDLGGSPRQLTPNGRLAGLTRDGVTASWVEPSGNLVQVPVAGGPAQTVFTGEVVTQPSMSPDGARYMWSYPGPDGFGGLNAIWINRLTVAGSKLEGVSYCGFCTTTHGWLNTMSIAAFPADENGRPSKVCRIASNEELPGESNSCVQTLVADARGGIGFPNGNAAGTELVAVLSPGERTGVRGRIVRYALPAGTPIGDVTAGTTDTTPIFSPEGDRVAFERDGQIVVRDLAGGAERVIGPGVYPFWGGARTLPVRVSGPLRVSSLRKGRATVSVACGAACRVRATLLVTRATARRLGLGATRTIAKGSGSRGAAGELKLRLRATKKAARRLGRARSYTATLDVTVSPPGGAATRTQTSVRVRR